MCHSHGETKRAGKVLQVPGARVSLPSPPCTRAGRGHTSFCLVPGVQGGTSQQLLYRAQLIQAVAACAGAQRLKVRISKIYGWNCCDIFLYAPEDN